MKWRKNKWIKANSIDDIHKGDLVFLKSSVGYSLGMIYDIIGSALWSNWDLDSVKESLILERLLMIVIGGFLVIN